nr:hypothetical protein CFP56_53373 [Quercus suber]
MHIDCINFVVAVRLRDEASTTTSRQCAAHTSTANRKSRHGPPPCDGEENCGQKVGVRKAIAAARERDRNGPSDEFLLKTSGLSSQLSLFPNLPHF